ncbi:hypothetical protein EXS65_04380 [Candidatus Peribacteria bacterium]|nr:hypothetical protein [Candidatus Peribacteria bacterium]
MHLGRIHKLAAHLETLQFPYCDVAHEDVARDEQGNVISEHDLVLECPMRLQRIRPACPHCQESISPDYVGQLIDELEEGGLDPSIFRERRMQYELDIKRLTQLDGAILGARTKSDREFGGAPDKAEAKTAAAPYVLEHRSIVDRMRELTTLLLSESKKILTANKV